MASDKIDDIYEFLDTVDEYIQTNDTSNLGIINDYSYYAFDRFGDSILFIIASNPGNLRRDNDAYKRTVKLLEDVIQYYKQNGQIDKLKLENKYNVPPFGEMTLMELMEKYEMPLTVSGGYRRKHRIHKTNKRKHTRKNTRRHKTHKRTQRRKHKTKTNKRKHRTNKRRQRR